MTKNAKGSQFLPVATAGLMDALRRRSAKAAKAFLFAALMIGACGGDGACSCAKRPTVDARANSLSPVHDEARAFVLSPRQICNGGKMLGGEDGCLNKLACDRGNRGACSNLVC